MRADERGELFLGAIGERFRLPARNEQQGQNAHLHRMRRIEGGPLGLHEHLGTPTEHVTALRAGQQNGSPYFRAHVGSLHEQIERRCKARAPDQGPIMGENPRPERSARAEAPHDLAGAHGKRALHEQVGKAHTEGIAPVEARGVHKRGYLLPESPCDI